MIVAMSPEIFGLQRFGGISRYFAELHRALRTQGIDARIIAGWHSSGHLDGLAGSTVWPHGGKRTARWIRLANEALFQAWCLRAGDELVVHRTYYDRQWRPRCGRLVTTVHDLIPELIEDGSGSNELSRLKRQACEESDGICVPSQTTARDLQSLWGFPKERIWITPLGVRRVEASERDWSSQYGQYILFVGNRSGYKNAAALFKAFSTARLSADTSLLCFGGGAPTDGERALLDGLGIVRRVHFSGGSDAELAACYRDALGYVCPSRYEGFGLPVLEAMIQGCPVACSHAGSLPEVASDMAIYFDPGSHEDMASALERLASSRDSTDVRRQSAVAHAESFSWSSTARQTMMAYEGTHSSRGLG